MHSVMDLIDSCSQTSWAEASTLFNGIKLIPIKGLLSKCHGPGGRADLLGKTLLIAPRILAFIRFLFGYFIRHSPVTFRICSNTVK